MLPANKDNFFNMYTEPVLVYYDVKKPCVIQTDDSKEGLGYCLMQDGHYILYSLKAMMKIEQRYAQIERVVGSSVRCREVLSIYIWTMLQSLK